MLRLYPRAYEDWSRPVHFDAAPLDTPCAVRAQVLQVGGPVFSKSGVMLLRVRVCDETGAAMSFVFFNNPYIPNLLHAGQMYLFYGKITVKDGRRQMVSPEFAEAGRAPGMRPIYPQTKGLSSRLIEKAVAQALRLLPDVLRDPLAQTLRQQYALCELRYALENIHRPPNEESMQVARRRLAFEELLVLQLGMLTLKGRNREESAFRVEQDCTDAFWALLPFSPTAAQRRAAAEAVADMESGVPMNRLIQGDVGSGKTAVAAACCFVAAKNGMQAALMAPTDILAHQHFETLSKMLAPACVRVALLTGAVKPKEKQACKEALLGGEIDVLVGTHALLTPDVQFCRLGLVITDEQHRFGVGQREALGDKGDRPHVLVMSATPIPRTLAIILYGDLDISVIDEMPADRLPIKNCVVTPDWRPKAYRFIEKEVAAGHQAYVICPMVKESEMLEAENVTDYTEKLRREFPSSIRVEALHGKMKGKEKNRIMEEFAAGEIQVLVSTTVVEVGVNVPNATVMMIENGERFGLAQLHQLRGRVGRGKSQSYCIMVNCGDEGAGERLDILNRSNDGFYIASEDLKLRGPGDIFGVRQSGDMEFKLADIFTDAGVLKKVSEEVNRLLAADPDLSMPEHRELKRRLDQYLERSYDKLNL